MRLYLRGGICGTEAVNDLAVAVNEEFGEVPLDLAAQQTALLFFEVGIEGRFVIAVDLYLGELPERNVVFQLAEADDLFIGPGSLIAELVAGEVEYLEPLVLVVLIELFEPLILGREAAARSGIDDEQHLALELRKTNVIALGILNDEII